MRDLLARKESNAANRKPCKASANAGQGGKLLLIYNILHLQHTEAGSLPRRDDHLYIRKLPALNQIVRFRSEADGHVHDEG